jgi:serine/threonine-protein kinase
MSTDEEARAYLQARLVVLSRLMFWSFVALLVGMVLLYARYPDIEPKRNKSIYEVALVGMGILVVLWRGALLRRKVTLGQLYAIDLFYGTGTGTIFASAAYLASDLKLASTANILWSCMVIFLRAIVIPSTGTRTAVVGAFTFLPMILAALGLSITTTQELPLSAFVGSTVIISIVVILLATISSRIIYGLRRQVSAAMRLGQYTLGAKIGSGGNGEVYRASHALLRRPTAVKLMRPDRVGAVTLDRFEREVQHMSQLTHPNTVAVFDYGRSPDGVFYYAMEYLDGIDLENLVIKFGPQHSDRVVAILIQVCGALHEAHRRGIIHRDIKPGNIILCERGDVPDVAKVVDFGLVKEITSQDIKDSQAQGILGTPHYLAPEVITDPETIGPAADLYALGAVGYFLLTGKRLFEGKNAVDVCVQHVTATPVPPSQVASVHISAELEQLVLRCLAKEPADRPESAGALAHLLRAVPSSNDWSEAEALRWWSDFRRLEEPASSMPTLTITVDLEQRE